MERTYCCMARATLVCLMERIIAPAALTRLVAKRGRKACKPRVDSQGVFTVGCGTSPQRGASGNLYAAQVPTIRWKHKHDGVCPHSGWAEDSRRRKACFRRCDGVEPGRLAVQGGKLTVTMNALHTPLRASPGL